MTLRQVTWKQRWEFLRSHLAQPNQIGAVTPSSRFLARAMLKAAPVDNALVVAELGAGTGVFTDHMLARLRPEAKLLVFETHPTFRAALAARLHDNRVEVLGNSAAELRRITRERGYETVDRIVSSLPFNAFPNDLTLTILEAIRDCMAPDSIMATYQYTPFQAKLFRSVFRRVEIAALEVRNIPPALVYVCRV